ncbi:MAG: COR domain-containing protein [Bacteroidota bacterium]
MDFLKRVEQGLESLSKTEKIAFAWRCAVRALPFLGHEGHFNFWEAQDRQKHLYSVFYALDIAVITTTVGNDIAAADTAAVDAADAAYVAKGNVDAIAAVDAAADAAAYAAAAAADIYAAADVYAATYAATAAKEAIDLKTIILQDIAHIKAGKQPQLSIATYGTIWDNFQQALDDVGCAYWGRLYQTLFEQNFEYDREKLQRRMNLPEELRHHAARAAAFLEEMDQEGAVRLNESRILILGDKGAGKTCMARRLLDPEAPMTTPEESTAGVDTLLWELTADKLNVRIWDFAGHTVTHAAHQFFLSERCLYLMVYDGRTDARSRLEYWLNQMRTYGGNSRVFVFVNEKDRHGIKIPVNYLRERYPMIVGFYAFNLKHDKEALEKFRKDIADYIKNTASWKNQEIPLSYYKVKEALEKRFSPKDTGQGEEYIKKATFLSLAKAHKVKDPERLLGDLHALGVSLWYREMAAYETLILNPEWISQGVYQIINWVNTTKQYSLTLTEFSEVFKDAIRRYPRAQHRFLFDLMKHYELAFEAENGALIIPHLLEEDQPEHLPVFHVGDSLMLRYEVDQPLPPDTISRFIVRHSEQIKKQGQALVWRYGVVLEDGKGSLAMVRELDRSINVSVKGRQKTAFLSTLRTTLNAIFESYIKLEPALKYRVSRFGEIPDQLATKDDLWLTGQHIRSYHQNNRTYFDALTGRDIPLDRFFEDYNISQVPNHYTTTSGRHIGTVLSGSEDHKVERTVVNIHEGNIALQGDLHALARQLLEKGAKEDAGALAKAAEILDMITKKTLKDGVKEQLKQYIAEDQMTTALKTLKTYVEEYCPDREDDVVHLSARYHSLRTAYHKDTISQEQYQQQKNRLTDAILDLIGWLD